MRYHLSSSGMFIWPTRSDSLLLVSALLQFHVSILFISFHVY